MKPEAVIAILDILDRFALRSEARIETRTTRGSSSIRSIASLFGAKRGLKLTIPLNAVIPIYRFALRSEARIETRERWEMALYRKIASLFGAKRGLKPHGCARVAPDRDIASLFGAKRGLKHHVHPDSMVKALSLRSSERSAD